VKTDDLPKLVALGEGVYAARCRYYMATERTLGLAVPSEFMLDCIGKKMRLRFAPESKDEAGQKRADSALMRGAFPVEVAILEGIVADLSQYVIFKVEENV
jgi:hypothetical protein